MVKLKIKDKEYTIEDARELYNELKGLFGEETPPLPWTTPVNVPWVQPYPAIGPAITYETDNDGLATQWYNFEHGTGCEHKCTLDVQKMHIGEGGGCVSSPHTHPKTKIDNMFHESPQITTACNHNAKAFFPVGGRPGSGACNSVEQ